MIGIALRTGKISSHTDNLRNPQTAFVQAAAWTFGYQSAASVPLRLNGQVIGLLNLAAVEPAFFQSEQEIGLLEEIGLDISFALDSMDIEKLRRQWADAFENCAYGISIGLPETNQILTCNPAFAKLQGYTVDEISSRPILTMFAPQDHDIVRKSPADADRTGRTQFETHMVRKDNSIYPVQIDVVCVRDQYGKLLYRVGTQQDITTRKQVQAEIDRLVERFGLATRAARLGVWDWDIIIDNLVWDDQMYILHGIIEKNLPVLMNPDSAGFTLTTGPPVILLPNRQ